MYDPNEQTKETENQYEYEDSLTRFEKDLNEALEKSIESLSEEFE
jgi:hypothetical protein